MTLLRENKKVEMTFDKVEEFELWKDRYIRLGYTVVRSNRYYSNIYKKEVYWLMVEYTIAIR